MSENTAAPVRVALVGCGPRAEGHARALRLSSDCELVACCDVVEDRAAAFAAEWGLRHYYSDLPTMLKDQELALVDVATPAAVRLPVVEQVAPAGVPGLLLEKPLAMRPDAGYRVLDLCRESGVQLYVNHQLRFFPPIQRFQEVLRAGKIGRIRMVRAATRWSLLEHGTHLFDLVNFLFEDALVPERLLVQASGWEEQAGMPECPTHTAGVLTTAEGPRVYFECGPWAPSWPGTINAWHQAGIDIVGSSGVAGWSLNRGWWYVGENGRDEERYEHDALDDVAQAALFDNIGAALRQTSPTLEAAAIDVPTDAARSAWSFQVVMAALRSACRRSWVDALTPVSDKDVDRLHEVMPEPLPESFVPPLSPVPPIDPATPSEPVVPAQPVVPPES
ncbi:Gfo/Idh/MocA family protein [Actinoplanes sp. URMC 104]|uniref:Gfo/Idh/MocA family protein n=1 Tax=Actinoplanes sp. URMC 104 TaxID=3423409 RepID=UPI003F1B1055